MHSKMLQIIHYCGHTHFNVNMFVGKINSIEIRINFRTFKNVILCQYNIVKTIEIFCVTLKII